jgi:hypothetical protein
VYYFMIILAFGMTGNEKDMGLRDACPEGD